ncbi:MAG: hypothetical protein WCQ91_04630 [Planctomycetota bacterium]
MRTFIMTAMVVAAASGRAVAIQPPWEAADECRAILEENFQRCGEENLKGLMQTISSYWPRGPQQKAEFMREAQQTFKDTDVYIRLTGFRLMKWDEHEAYALVHQLTLPAEMGANAIAPDQATAEYRRLSGLLPEDQHVEYVQQFLYERGKWKTYRIKTAPRPVEHGSSAILDGSTEYLSAQQTGGPMKPKPEITVRKTPGTEESPEQRAQYLNGWGERPCPDGKCKPLVTVRSKK